MTAHTIRPADARAFEQHLLDNIGADTTHVLAGSLNAEAMGPEPVTITWTCQTTMPMEEFVELFNRSNISPDD